MKKRILYSILLLLFVGLAGVFATSDMEGTAKQDITLAVVAIGSIAITREDGVAGAVIFDNVIEDWVGGATLGRTRLPSDNTQILGGALLYIENGLAEVIKTATVVAGSTTTAVRVKKQHLYKVSDVVMLATGGRASEITAIDTSHADYDVFTIATLGSTPSVDAVLVEAAAVTTGSDSAAKYTANAILKNTENTERANPNASGVVRGSVRSEALPYGAFSGDITALNLIRFV